MAQAGPSSGTAGTHTGVDECKSEGCICCKHIKKGIDKFQSTATGKQYNITQYLTCKTRSVVYIIQCKKEHCMAQYVGSTTSTLQRRFNDHSNSIRYRQRLPISGHSNHNDHYLEDMIVYPVEQVTGSKALKDRELYWIRELKAVALGLNPEPSKCGEQSPDDDEEGSEGPAGIQLEESRSSGENKHEKHRTEETVPETAPMAQADTRTGVAFQKSKRKRRGNDDLKSKKRKPKNYEQPKFSSETKKLLSTCEHALEDGKQTISEVYAKLNNASCTEEQSTQFLEDLKKKISDLKEYDQKEKIYIGLFGKTGAGKSSLINAIVNKNHLLPSGSLDACTSVFVYVQANTESSKYKADIEFITLEDWKLELRFLVEILKNENDQQSTAEETAADDEMVKMARQKITAFFGKEGLEKSYTELEDPREYSEIPRTYRKTMKCDTAKELSQNIGCYIRSDKKSKTKKFWPLVKRVTISLPESPALLERIVLVDLPGAGDVNKQRSEMWRECLSQCSAVWIVNDINRALSEAVPSEIFDKTLSHIAGGGECHNITFICTKTDIINSEEIKENYDITDEDLAIECDPEDPQYEDRLKQACICFRNDELKEDISLTWKEKIKRFLLGDEGHSDDFFDVYTVSSEEFRRIAQRKSVLNHDQTELPLLMEHIKKMYVSHSVKEVKDYVSEVSGIISYLHFSKDALNEKDQTSNLLEFNRLQKRLNETCETLNSALTKLHTEFQEKLKIGAKAAEINCLENAKKDVLEPTWCDNRGHHRTLKALCRNDGYHRSDKVRVLNLNHTLSEPMYKKMKEKNLFHRIFGTGGSRTSINGHFASFYVNFITIEDLKNYKTKNKTTYLRLVYIRTEQRKLLKNLEEKVREKKKLIYNSLSDSIRDTMKPTYQECTDIHGKYYLIKIQEKLKSGIEKSKKDMFLKARNKMLDEFSEMKEFLVTEIQKKMKDTLTLALHQKPDGLTGLPDVSEEMKKMENICEALGLQLF